MRRAVRLFTHMTGWERKVLLGCSILGALSLIGMYRQFWLENTVLMPRTGGTYIEGAVGDLRPLNPWFTIENDVNRDIVSLVFAGLQKYNPKTRKIEDDLAALRVSDDRKVFTLTLRDNIFWHDSTQAKPHPVTSEDVVFTYQTIQKPDFPNGVLQQNLRGVTVEAIDSKTIRFTLEQPYSFFPSTLTLGIVPKRSFADVPVAKLDRESDTGFSPIGAGPFTLKSLVQTDLSTEVTLEKFALWQGTGAHLQRLVFRIFSDYPTLLSDIRNLHGVRLVPRGKTGELAIPRHFESAQYTLPQYVALFFNTERPALQDSKLRVGLQLGTNKQEIIDEIRESTIVDTPLLEIRTDDWHYKFDDKAAQGALLASKWNLPERYRLQHVLEQREANKAGVLTLPPLLKGRANEPVLLTGSLANLPADARVNGVPVQPASGTGTWRVLLPLFKGSGALRGGENLIRLADAKGKVLDSSYVFLALDDDLYSRVQQEQLLAEQFATSKSPTASATDRISIEDLALDRGFLRRRLPDDAPTVRQNERGDQLRLTLLTSPSPASYATVAKLVQKQWATLGVLVTVDIPATRQEFEKRMLRRDYDVLLFGQSLLDNLDSYPYWHSSEVQRLTNQDKDLRQDAYNLSQYRSVVADSLLEEIRTTKNEVRRKQALQELQAVIRNDVPAVFLYSPQYTYAHREKLLGVQLGALSLHSDRFLTLNNWYTQESRVFLSGRSVWSFPGWFFKKISL